MLSTGHHLRAVLVFAFVIEALLFCNQVQADPCPICQEDFQKGDNIVSTCPPFHHDYHYSCLKEWLSTNSQTGKKIPRCIFCQKDIRRIMMSHKKSAEQATWMLLNACRHGNRDAALKAIKNGALLKEDGLKDSPLSIAARKNCIEIMKLLLEYNAPVDALLDDGTTALHVACIEGSLEAAELLIEHGADVNHVNRHGKSVLMDAVISGHQDIVLRLLNEDININAVSDTGNSALIFACARKNDVVVKALIEKGSTVNCANKNGNTPLMFACRTGSKQVVQLLLEAGADVSRRNNAGESAFDVAQGKITKDKAFMNALRPRNFVLQSFKDLWDFFIDRK